MERQNVSSSNLRSVGYDAQSQILEIEFRNGRVYQYYEVPQDIYKDLMTAASKGSYFNDVIKDAYNTARSV